MSLWCESELLRNSVLRLLQWNMYLTSFCLPLFNLLFGASANLKFQNELLQIERMLLQIKTSEVFAPTEGRRSGYLEFFLFLSGELLYFFLGLCDYLDKFPKRFCSSCSMECPSTTNFCHQYGQQLNLSQVSNKAASSVDKEKLLKKYFHRGYLYAAFIWLCGQVIAIAGVFKSCDACYRRF